MKGERVVYDREQLYEEVWREPLRDVAKRYGVSDVALGKICRRLAVPTPGLGYWAKIRAGKAPTRTPLGEAPPGTPTRLKVTRPPRVPPRAPRRPTIEAVKPPAKTVVPRSLQNPHPLVAQSCQLLKGVGRKDQLLSRPYERCLDIRVSPPRLFRALRILHALIRGLEKQGFRVEVTKPLVTDAGWSYGKRIGSEPSVTRVLVEGHWIAFGLEERQSMIKEEPEEDAPSWAYPRTKFVPNGSLSLCLREVPYSGMRKSWNDGKRQRLEDCLDDFISYLPVVAGAIQERDAEREQARLRAEEARQRREEEEARREAARRRREEEERMAAALEGLVANRRLAQDIRRFLVELEEAIPAGGSSGCPGVKWALAYADQIPSLSCRQPPAFARSSSDASIRRRFYTERSLCSDAWR